MNNRNYTYNEATSTATKSPRLPKSPAEYVQTADLAIQGAGGDGQTYEVALTLVGHYGLGRDQALSLMEQYNARLNDKWTTGGLEHKVDSALQYISRGGEESGKETSRRVSSRRSVTGDELRRKVVSSRQMRAEYFEDAVPEHLDNGWFSAHPSTRAVLYELFPATALLCVGKDQEKMKTAPLGTHGNFDELQFIVPNPMTKGMGYAQNRRQSHRCRDNAAVERSYLVVECDLPRIEDLDEALRKAEKSDEKRRAKIEEDVEFVRWAHTHPKLKIDSFDIQARILRYLAQYLPLVMVVKSGGKSLHGWFRITDFPEDHVAKFIALAIELGADPAPLTRPEQAVRMPGGTRYKDSTAITRQDILFFCRNAEVLEFENSEPLPDLRQKAGGMLKSPKAVPEAYFEHTTSKYWLCDNAQYWISFDSTRLARHMAVNWFGTMKGSELSARIQSELNKIEFNQAVDYVGALSGYPEGRQEFADQRILITGGPKLIEPVEGSWPTLERFFKELLDDPEQDQRPYFFGWLQCAVSALRKRKLFPGQCLVVAGPRKGGKNLLQEIITMALGGRAARAYEFLSKQTSFNDDLIKAEHLVIQDQAATGDRRWMANAIKDVVANEIQRVHQKHKAAISFRPFWRLSISLNEEIEDLMVLPDLRESLNDKLIILRTGVAKLPPTHTPDERDALMAELRSEMPAFLFWLLNVFQIPSDLKADRFGVKHYHHPDLVKRLHELSPEAELLSLVDSHLFNNDFDPIWEGSAGDLHKLLSSRGVAREFNVRRIGRLLGDLQKLLPGRIKRVVRNGYTIWSIQRLLE